MFIHGKWGHQKHQVQPGLCYSTFISGGHDHHTAFPSWKMSKDPNLLIQSHFRSRHKAQKAQKAQLWNRWEATSSVVTMIHHDHKHHQNTKQQIDTKLSHSRFSQEAADSSSALFWSFSISLALSFPATVATASDGPGLPVGQTHPIWHGPHYDVTRLCLQWPVAASALTDGQPASRGTFQRVYLYTSDHAIWWLDWLDNPKKNMVNVSF